MEKVQRDGRGHWLKGTTPPGAKPFKKGQSGNPSGRPKGAKDRKNRLREAIAAQEHLQGVLSTPEGAAGALAGAVALTDGVDALMAKPEKIVEAAAQLASLAAPIVAVTKGPRVAKRVAAELDDDDGDDGETAPVLVQEPVSEVDYSDRVALLNRFAPIAFQTLERVCNDDAAPAAARVSASAALLGFVMTKPATETKITAGFDAPTQHLLALQELNRLAQAPRLIEGTVSETECVSGRRDGT